MKFKLFSCLCLFGLLTGPLFATDPPAPAKRVTLPESVVVVPPTPPPSPNTPQALAAGQWYVIDSTVELLVKQFSLDGAELDIKAKKVTSPMPVPANLAIGRKPDADDPEIATIAGPYVYIVKAKKSSVAGNVILTIQPLAPTLGADGKPAPLADSDFIQRAISVGGASPTPKPAPETPDSPTSDPLFPALQAAFKADGSPADAASKLAGVFNTAAASTVNDQSIKTLKDLLSDVGTAGRSLVPLPTGAKFREVLAGELDAKLGKNTAASLDADLRISAQKQFQRIGKLLSALK